MSRKNKMIFTAPIGFLFSLWQMCKKGARLLYLRKRYHGTTLQWGVVCDEDCSFEKGVIILQNAHVQKASVGRQSYIGHGSSIQNCTIGRFCSIAPYVMIGLGRHPLDKSVSTSLAFYRSKAVIPTFGQDINFDEYSPVTIGHDVWIGARAIILDGVNIGHGAVIGAGAVVTKDVPPYTIVAGVPAREVRTRFSKEIIEKLLAFEWWNREPEWLAQNVGLFSDVDKLLAYCRHE